MDFVAEAPVVEGVEIVFEELELLAEGFDSLDAAAWLLADEPVWMPEEPPHAASTRAASTSSDTALAGLNLPLMM
ncbi:MAG TPA: hypothetical protein VK721_15140 [Solirubrobacteraceae bacterium]|nr:hypothetical protein [Solirubrobacteraceae bacterium]